MNRPGPTPTDAAAGASPRRAGGAPARPLRWARLLALGLALLGLGLVGLAASFRLGVGVEAAKRDFVAALSQAARASVTIAGPVELSLLPASRFVADEVTLETAGGETLHVRRIVADLDRIEALFGTAAVERLVLVEPTLETAPGFGEAAAGAPVPSVSALAAAVARLQDVESVEIRNGSARPRGGRGRGVSQIDLVLRNGRFGSGSTIEGSFLWNGERASLEASLGAAAATGSDPSPVALDLLLETSVLTASVEGQASAGAAPSFEGEVRLAAASLVRAAAWLGYRGPTLPELGPLSIETPLALSAGRAAMPEAELVVAGSRGHGALILAAGGGAARPSLDGTLAFADLDLSRLGGALAPPPAGPAGLDRPIAAGFLGLLDLDLRVSAAEAWLGAQPVSDLAATLHLEGGVATLDLGDASLFGGRAEARLVVDAGEAAPALRGGFGLRGADLSVLGESLGLAAAELALAGQASVEGTIDLPVTSWAALARGARVSARIESRDGTLTPALPWLAGTPGAALFAAPDGPLPYAAMEARIALLGPRARLEAFRLEAPGGVLSISGTLAERDGTVSLAGAFRPAALSEGEASVWAAAEPRRVTLDGRWPAPAVGTGPLGPAR